MLSAAPGVADLSPALLQLTDYVFHRRDGDAPLVRARAASRAVFPMCGSKSTNLGAIMKTNEWLLFVIKKIAPPSHEKGALFRLYPYYCHECGVSTVYIIIILCTGHAIIFGV